MKRQAIASLILVAFFLVPSITVTMSQTASDEWPLLHNDATNGCFSSSTAPDTNSTSWIYSMGGLPYYSPVISEGRVYASNGQGNAIYCIDASTGSLLWKDPIGNNPGSPTVMGGKLYVVLSNGTLCCLNSHDGALVWARTIAYGGTSSLSAPMIAENKIFVSSDLTYSAFYCIDALNGTTIWTANGPMYEFTSFSYPTVVDGKVYVGTSKNATWCLNSTTGDRMWTYNAGGSIPIVTNGRTYFYSISRSGFSQVSSANVYCLNASDGRFIWNYTITSNRLSCISVASGKIYFGSNEGYVYCLDALTGAFVWKCSVTKGILSSPAIADGKIYIGSYDESLYCLDMYSGALKWKYAANGMVASPAIANGKVYAVSEAGNVYCFGLKSTSSLTPVPVPSTSPRSSALPVPMSPTPKSSGSPMSPTVSSTVPAATFSPAPSQTPLMPQPTLTQTPAGSTNSSASPISSAPSPSSTPSTEVGFLTNLTSLPAAIIAPLVVAAVAGGVRYLYKIWTEKKVRSRITQLYGEMESIYEQRKTKTKEEYEELLRNFKEKVDKKYAEGEIEPQSHKFLIGKIKGYLKESPTNNKS